LDEICIKGLGKRRRSSQLLDRVKKAYEDIETRENVEEPPQHDRDTRLPQRGMQVRGDYTMYGHFFYLRMLLAGVEKFRFYMDQKSGIRAACLAAGAKMR
jgi:hypothetical protein